MSLLKFSFYVLILIIASVVNAEQDAESEEIISDEIVIITQDWLATQKEVISQIKSSLKDISKILKKQRKKLKKNLRNLKRSKTVTDIMLEDATEQKQLFKTKLGEFEAKYKQHETDLDKHTDYVVELQTDLKNIDPKEKDEIIELQQKIKLYQQAIKLESTHIDLFIKKIKLIVDQTIIAMKWHNQLQVVHIEHLIKKHQQTIKRVSSDLRKDERKLKIETEEQQENLENLPNLEKITNKILDAAIQTKQHTNDKLEDLRMERQTSQGRLESYSTRIAELQTSLDELSKFKDRKLIQEYDISKLTQHLTLYQQLNSLEKVYNDLLNKKNKVVIQQAILDLHWYAQLEDSRVRRVIEKQEQMIDTAKNNLIKNKEILGLKQKDLPNKIITLKTTESTATALKEKVEKAALNNNTAEIEAKNLDLEYQSSETNLERLRDDFKQLQIKADILRKTPPVEAEQLSLHTKRIAILEKNIKLQTRILELESHQLDIIKQQIEQANKQVTLNVEWYDKVKTVYLIQQKQELEKHIRYEQQRYFKQAEGLRQKLDLIPDLEKNSAKRYSLEVQIQISNEMAQRAMRQLKIRHITDQLEQWQKTAIDQQELQKVLQTHIDSINILINELSSLLLYIKGLDGSLKNKISVLEQQLKMTIERGKTLSAEELQYNKQTQEQLTKLQSILKQELNKLPRVVEKGDKLLILLGTVYKDNVHKALIRQRTLPTSIGEWQGMLAEIATIPKVFLEQLEFIQQSFIQATQQTTRKNWLIFGSIIFAWSLLVIWFRFWSAKIIKDTALNKKYLLRLWHKNSFSIIFTSSFLLFIWITEPNQSSILFSLILLAVFFVGKLLLNLAWLILSQVQESNKFYPRVRRVIIIISILIIITAQIHLLPEGQISLDARDLIDSIFMILLSLAIPILFSIRKFIIAPLEDYVQGYLLTITKLLLLTLPMIILSVSILGVVGYISLGWVIIKYLSMLLLVLLSWMIVQLFLDTLINIWKKIVLKQGVYGSLWAEDLIPLIHSVLGLGLSVLAVMSLLWLTGWYSDVAIREGVSGVLNYPLTTFANGNHITIISIFMSVVMIWIVFWFGSWAQRITYRWIFSNIADSGIRHSLSIFTQYTIVILGLTSSLRVIGIDPTALSVFAGALGVGIGFGMRSLVANFISGVLLLIERPLRVGDLIDIGGNSQGVVKHIGIRSTMIETDDKRISVPNSRVIDRPFTNLGRNDDIKDDGEKINIEVGCENDPHMVKNILTTIMVNTPQILDKPEPQVLLVELIDNKISFSINYHLASLTDAEVVKSQLLFDIWDQFKTKKIKVSQTVSPDFLSKNSSNNDNDDDFAQLFLK
ncbi:MAG: mechanosensitive ion channel [Candidatus Marithrix sp.]